MKKIGSLVALLTSLVLVIILNGLFKENMQLREKYQGLKRQTDSLEVMLDAILGEPPSLWDSASLFIQAGCYKESLECTYLIMTAFSENPCFLFALELEEQMYLLKRGAFFQDSFSFVNGSISQK